MRYGLTLVTAPTLEPVTLGEAKRDIGVEDGNDHWDLDVEKRWIPSARREVEKRASRQFINATWDLKLDRFPSSTEPIYIPRSPLSSVSSITYTDAAGDSQTLATTVYKVITSREPGEIRLKYGQAWPVVYAEKDVVAIRFVAGYGATASTVPEECRNAIRLQLKIDWDTEMGQDTRQARERLNDLLSSISVGDEFHCYAVE